MLTPDKFNETTIKALPVPAKGNKFHGFAGATVQGKPIPRGLGVVVTAKGARSFVLNYTFAGKECRKTIGPLGEWNVPRAIEKANELRDQIEAGYNPLETTARRVKETTPDGKAIMVWDTERRATPVTRNGKTTWRRAAEPEREKSLRELWESWERARRNDKSKRDPVHQRGMFKNHILPKLGDRPFKQIRRAEYADLVDNVRENVGPSAANRVVSYLSAVLNWQEEREDDWEAPRLARLKTKEKSRERVLSADEIRALWPAFEAMGTFGKFCKLLLLTSQRRSDIAGLRWNEIYLETATVRIPAERYKTGASHEFPLSRAALAILTAIPLRKDGRLFTSIQFSFDKRRLDKLAPVPGWTLHDLRRTGASLMFANGVVLDDIDRLQGHAIRGIAQTYVRGAFMEQKRRAAETLARVIDRIVHSEMPPENVVELRSVI